MKEKQAKLLLLPNLIGDHKYHEPFLPQSTEKAVKSLDGLIAESEKGGRRYLSRFLDAEQTRMMPIALLNEHSAKDDVDFFLEPLAKGEVWGLVSDAGLPCVADPGAKLVFRARQRGFQVQAFIGPSSMMLALMLSGLPGQEFSFHGYLGRQAEQRERAINKLEQESKKTAVTQIFMEAPYRNEHLLESLLKTLNNKTYLAVAWDLTMPTQGVICQQVGLWKKIPKPNIHKKPAVFLISCI
jgi:16S rRNA (cytidine1402-2'-O)-methyltransferase